MLYDSILIDGKKYGITYHLKLPDEINPLKITKKTIITYSSLDFTVPLAMFTIARSE